MTVGEMPKRKPRTPEMDAPEPVAEQVMETGASSDSPSEKPEKVRKGVFIPFNEDGSVDTKRLAGNDWKIEAARKAIASHTGLSEAKVSGMEVSDDMVRGLYRGFEVLLQRAGVMFLKWPKDLAVLIAYSDAQKAKLVPPTKVVMEKFAPSWLVKHQEIATLAIVLAAETQDMIQNALQQYIALHPELIASPIKPNGHDQGSENRHQEPVAVA